MPQSLVTFVSRHGVRARMAAVLFHRTAQRSRAVAEARSFHEPGDVGVDVGAAFADFGDLLDMDARAEPLSLQAAMEKPFLVVIGEPAPGYPPAHEVWPTFELDGTAERARLIRDALLSWIVILVEQQGWIETTQRYERMR